MKVLVLLLLVAVASGFPTKATTTESYFMQKDILGLLYRVSQPLSDKFSYLTDISKNYVPSTHADKFKDGGTAVAKLDVEVSEKTLLQKHKYFSLFDESHRANALMLVDVLMNSKDWVTFSSSAVYYRELMNEGAFTYALYVSVIHSPIASSIVLPPLYEITPHMFTNSEVIRKAYSAKMTNTPSNFHMNFTGSRKNPEQRVAYFGEDIGMNVHHVSWHMDYPFWWEDSYGHKLDRKGELFFWMHHQLTARFDAERLSNYLNPVDELYWDRPIVEGFAPHTTYRYGGEFPSRPDNKKFEDVVGVVRIRDMMIMEDRIRDAIAHGYVEKKDGTPIDIRNEKGIDILGDVIESSTYSPNRQFYGAFHNLAHIMLGRQGDPKGKFNMPPGVMEHFETATRDPSFFRLHKYMDNIFKEHKDSLPSYTKDEIAFPGVSVKDVKVDGRLETFFESFDFDISQAVDYTSSHLDDVKISASVDRLNHIDFALNMEVFNNNPHPISATVRVFLCPRQDANGILYTLNEGRWHCVEMDKFWETLAPGSNTIIRQSQDAATTIPDIPGFNSLLEQTEEAIKAKSELNLKKYSRSCGIPNRMLLPKGTKTGMEFALLVAVTDGRKDITDGDVSKVEGVDAHCQCGVHGEKYPDSKPLGFPLDRKIVNEKVLLNFPNFSKTTVTIKHLGHK